MCFGRCAKCVGYILLTLAVLSIVANILLYFPNGETKYARENHLSRYVWFFEGIAGAGLLVSTSFYINAAKVGFYCVYFRAHSPSGRREMHRYCTMAKPSVVTYSFSAAQYWCSSLQYHSCPM